MKKLPLIVLLMTFAGNAFSQQATAPVKKKLNIFSIRAGYGVCNFVKGNYPAYGLGQQDELLYNNFKTQSFFFIGAGVDAPLSKAIHIAASIDLGNYQSGFIISGGGGHTGGGAILPASWTYAGTGQINYFAAHIPVTVRFYVVKNFFLGAGPSYDVIFSNTGTRNYTTTFINPADGTITDQVNFSRLVSLKDGVPGICVEAGKRIPLSKNALAFVLSLTRTNNIGAYDSQVPYNLYGNYLSLAIDFYPNIK